MNQQTARNQAALAHLAWVFGDGWTAGDTGPAMSCMEADAIASALARGGHVDEAEVWLRGHAAADNEEEDTHWGIPREALRDYALMLGAKASIVDVLRRALGTMPATQERELRETFPKTTAKLDGITAGLIDPSALVGVLEGASPPVRSWSEAEGVLNAVLS
ncbi:hypothetical protein [Pseudonocardia parietis]|uniref:DUF222 domain-containing protein n=1 Tax=Pseudonocardia parietis TaxID=570936 RepID=A0ABS4W576_9PSEU|nr:hypothetical protein [Pseudonocardia parietis]MBP2371371.1 hypothetical protein [Pseudonocardia parietis]